MSKFAPQNVVKAVSKAAAEKNRPVFWARPDWTAVGKKLQHQCKRVISKKKRMHLTEKCIRSHEYGRILCWVPDFLGQCAITPKGNVPDQSAVTYLPTL
jgi:hypothetical protein